MADSPGRRKAKLLQGRSRLAVWPSSLAWSPRLLIHVWQFLSPTRLFLVIDVYVSCVYRINKKSGGIKKRIIPSLHVLFSNLFLLGSGRYEGPLSSVSTRSPFLPPSSSPLPLLRPSSPPPLKGRVRGKGEGAGTGEISLVIRQIPRLSVLSHGRADGFTCTL